MSEKPETLASCQHGAVFARLAPGRWTTRGDREEYRESVKAAAGLSRAAQQKP